MRIAEEIGRRLRRAADTGQLGDAMRRDVELEKSLDDRRGNGVVAAARAERRDRAFVVAPRIAERVLRQTGMMDFRFGQISHRASLRNGVTLKTRAFSAISRVMKRSVIGVPS